MGSEKVEKWGHGGEEQRSDIFLMNELYFLDSF